VNNRKNFVSYWESNKINILTWKIQLILASKVEKSKYKRNLKDLSWRPLTPTHLSMISSFSTKTTLDRDSFKWYGLPNFQGMLHELWNVLHFINENRFRYYKYNFKKSWLTWKQGEIKWLTLGCSPGKGSVYLPVLPCNVVWGRQKWILLELDSANHCSISCLLQLWWWKPL
jgi:hypothetical protein